MRVEYSPCRIVPGRKIPLRNIPPPHPVCHAVQGRGNFSAGENFAGKFSPLRKVANFPPQRTPWRVTNNFTANSDAGEYSVYQTEGRDKDVFVCNMQWLCDWDALECRVAQDFESAHQEITASFRIPGGAELFPFQNCPLANSPPPLCYCSQI